MKIGFSFSKCLQSMVSGEVAFNDVLLIVARTNMQSVEGVRRVITQYFQRGDLHGADETVFQEVGLRLWSEGKVIEPRGNGVSVMQVPREYVWMDLFPTEANLKSDGTKQAWENYRIMIGLTEQLPEQIGDNSVLTHRSRIIPEEA